MECKKIRKMRYFKFGRKLSERKKETIAEFLAKDAERLAQTDREDAKAIKEGLDILSCPEEQN